MINEKRKAKSKNSEMKKIIVCLGSGVGSDGSICPNTQKRVKKAVGTHKENPSVKIVFSGGFTNPAIKMSEAQAMFNYAKIVDSSLSESSVILEEKSKDTIGNGIYTKELIDNSNYIDLFLVTSDFHMKRALWIFKFVFGEQYNIYAVESVSDKQTREAHRSVEISHLGLTELLFIGIKRGDLKAIERRAYFDPKFQFQEN